MLERVYQSSFARRYKRYPLFRRIKKSLPIRLLEQSAGDRRYPFLLLCWWLSGVLVPRRRVSVGGVSFTLSCTNRVTHFRWYLFKEKEPEVRYYIDEYVKDGDIFFDIGANVGVFSLYAAKRYSDVSVYCFEPEYSNLNILKENIICNDLCGKTKVYGIGVSDFDGLSRLHLQDLATGSAAHTENREAITLTDEGYPVVWAEGIFSGTLDYICRNVGAVPNALKIDTDGNEIKILEGAENTLSDKRLRSLVIEIPDNEEKRRNCYARLETAGFRSVEYDMKKSRNEIWVKK